MHSSVRRRVRYVSIAGVAAALAACQSSGGGSARLAPSDASWERPAVWVATCSAGPGVDAGASRTAAGCLSQVLGEADRFDVHTSEPGTHWDVHAAVHGLSVQQKSYAAGIFDNVPGMDNKADLSKRTLVCETEVWIVDRATGSEIARSSGTSELDLDGALVVTWEGEDVPLGVDVGDPLYGQTREALLDAFHDALGNAGKRLDRYQAKWTPPVGAGSRTASGATAGGGAAEAGYGGSTDASPTTGGAAGATPSETPGTAAEEPDDDTPWWETPDS